MWNPKKKNFPSIIQAVRPLSLQKFLYKDMNHLPGLAMQRPGHQMLTDKLRS